MNTGSQEYEDDMRRADKHNERIARQMRYDGVPDAEIDSFMNPLERIRRDENVHPAFRRSIGG